jgi:hypothetical protein
MTFRFTDAVTVSGTRETADGYLVAEARSVRTGIQQYLGSEVGKADMDVVNVYRPEEEVFADASLQSFSHSPMTMNHPADAVTADNWKELSVGEVSTAAKRDGEWVMLPLILKDRAAIDAVKAGKCELSAGYTCTLDWTPGETPEGEAYDAIQRNIKINHLAVVDKARAGSKARIGDDVKTWGIRPAIEDKGASVMTDKTTQIVRDGLPVNLPDSAAPIINKWLADADKALKDKQTALDKALADLKERDTELGKKDAEIDDLKTKTVDNANIDQMVADRAAVVSKAKAIAPKVVTDGVKNADIKRAAVAAKLGDEKVKDRSDEYVDGLFDHLTSDVKAANPLSAALADAKPGDSDPQAVRDAAYKTHLAELTGQSNEKDA